MYKRQGEDHERGKSVKVGHAQAARISGNFRIVPLNGEGDRSIAEHTEIVAIVGVLRNPLAGKDQVLPESLFEASVELITNCLLYTSLLVRDLRRARARKPAARGVGHPAGRILSLSLIHIS